MGVVSGRGASVTAGNSLGSAREGPGELSNCLGSAGEGSGGHFGSVREESGGSLPFGGTGSGGFSRGVGSGGHFGSVGEESGRSLPSDGIGSGGFSCAAVGVSDASELCKFTRRNAKHFSYSIYNISACKLSYQLHLQPDWMLHHSHAP